MKYRRSTYGWLVLFGMVSWGCEPTSVPEPPPAEHAEASAPEVPVVTASWHARQTVVGRVVLRRTLTLRAAHPGRVADCRWEVGGHVQPGDVLLHLTGPRVEAPRQMLDDDLQIIEEQQKKARSDVEQFSKLLANGLLNEDDKRLVAARAVLRERTLAMAKVHDQLGQLDAATTVVAPVAGAILELPVRDGSDVVADGPVAVLAVAGDVALEATVLPVPELTLRRGLRAEVHLDRTAPPRVFAVDYLLPHADAQTGAAIIGLLPGALGHHLRVGQRVSIDLVGDAVPTVVVPASAVVSRAGKTYCVKRSGEAWQAVEVRVVGSDAAGRVHLSAGLGPDDRVMSEGVYTVIYRDFRKLFTFED